MPTDVAVILGKGLYNRQFYAREAPPHGPLISHLTEHSKRKFWKFASTIFTDTQYILIGDTHYVDRFWEFYVICDQSKWVWTRFKKKESFHFQYIYSNSRAILCWKPDQNWTYGARYIAILAMLKTIKYKGNLTLNIGSISKSILASSDPFYLFTSHISVRCTLATVCYFI